MNGTKYRHCKTMEQYEYHSYNEYIRIQKRGYKKKRKRTWAQEGNIGFLSELLTGATNGLCHGVRTGAEVLWFRKYLKAFVIGTEIGAEKKGLIVQWDFNKIRPSWVGRFDFVYSNSFDHSYNPAATMQVWVEQLRPGGSLVIEHSRKHEQITNLDPFGAKPDEIVKLMECAGLTDIKVHPMPCLLSNDRYIVGIVGVKRG